MLHHVPLERRTLHGHFSRDLQPVIRVEPGDSVQFPALNAGWRWEPDREHLAQRDPVLDDGHALIGPIEVVGARAGQTLAVGIDEVQVAGWGVTVADDAAFHWTLDAEAGTGSDERGAQVALAPFLGVIGMPPPEPGVYSTTPPRPWGGNLDCRELVVGSTLYLPVPVDGALLSAGDGHAAQGDGEVCGTAIECPLERVQLTLDLHDGLELRMPLARTRDAWIAFGLDPDLDIAAELALQTMLDLLQREHGLERPHAFALASVAVDLRVTQVVNQTKGVHAVLRDGALRS
jgi:acetamidase/formamidase